MTADRRVALLRGINVGGANRIAMADLRHDLAAEEWEPDALRVGRHVAYARFPQGSGRSPLWARLNRAAGDGITARNLATFHKIRDLLDTA